MKRNLIYIFLSLFLFSCGTDSGDSTEIELEKFNGTWELTTEVVNNTEMDCTSNPIKTRLEIKSEGYYILYDDLSSIANQSDLKVRKEILKQGQYDLQDTMLTLLYNIGGKDRTMELIVRRLETEHLELFNPESKLLSKYKKI